MDFADFLAPVALLEALLARLLAVVPRLEVPDFVADRLDSAGPLDADRALADRVPRVEPRVELRAGALVPARVFFALLRDLEDFFARAAMTVSSRE